jgi:hypothetical protein
MPGGAVLNNQSLILPGFCTSQAGGEGSNLVGDFSNADLASITARIASAPATLDLAMYLQSGICATAKTIAATLATLDEAERFGAFCDVFIPA